MSAILKILVVDDSAIYRSLVQGCLRDVADVKCVGVANDGRDAIDKARQLKPDLILLDVEMPVMNGVEALPKLREVAPEAGVIVVSSVTTDGADVTMEALQAGAFDFVTKPQVKAGEDGFAALREPLIATIAAWREGRAQRARPPMPTSKPSGGVSKAPAIDVVAIGVSTGGPSALSELVRDLPESLRVPILIVQHMPARFTASLATSLDRRAKLRVLEAEDGRPLRAGEVVIAAGGRHLTVAAGAAEPHAKLLTSAPVNGFKPAVDVLFKSVAAVMPGRALSIVMTGMGSDGLEGVKAIRARGGWCIAQDQASCAVFGMPRSVIEAGAADEVIALDGIARRLMEIAGPK